LEAYTLYDLNEYIRRVIALNFEEPIWIQCEIGQCKESRGQYYLELIEKDEASGEIKAKSSAIIWYKTFLFIKKKLGDLTNAILQDGSEIKIKVELDFNEKYGLKLVVLDIDPSYTIGQHELSKRKVYEQLKKEGILEINSTLALPSVIQNIAVVSSKTAAGLQDFMQELNDNSYGYNYNITLFNSSVQGGNAEREIVASLRDIKEKSDLYDCTVIIRGGGSKLDLSCFDSYNIAMEISRSQLPLVIGIGHDIDQTITDLVAHTSLKTPTAVASFLIEHNLNFEENILALQNEILFVADQIVGSSKADVEAKEVILSNLAGRIIQKKILALDHLVLSIPEITQRVIQRQENKLDMVSRIISSNTIASVLKKGYVIVRQDGKHIPIKKALKNKKEIELEFIDGKEIIIPTK
jgi:exodeoxyribonuclease VII large subunit